jgi:hypothetical protein
VSDDSESSVVLDRELDKEARCFRTTYPLPAVRLDAPQISAERERSCNEFPLSANCLSVMICLLTSVLPCPIIAAPLRLLLLVPIQPV